MLGILNKCVEVNNISSLGNLLNKFDLKIKQNEIKKEHACAYININALPISYTLQNLLRSYFGDAVSIVEIKEKKKTKINHVVPLEVFKKINLIELRAMPLVGCFAFKHLVIFYIEHGLITSKDLKEMARYYKYKRYTKEKQALDNIANKYQQKNKAKNINQYLIKL
ncbi:MULTISPECIES: hypothetical protein [Cysteiniphilum]|uniref:hypothetical protein n=1 Tax=Cysteiniphilum TaxID=2056696 RepID=UPI00177AF4D4|nr:MULTISPECIES: hypothetical protein [Cysteiniphilum]